VQRNKPVRDMTILRPMLLVKVFVNQFIKISAKKELLKSPKGRDRGSAPQARRAICVLFRMVKYCSCVNSGLP
jgi:hypothetical protein